MRLKPKLLIIFLLIALLPIAAISFISVYNFYSILERSIGENFAHTAQEKASSIDYVISERVAEVKKLASLPQIKDSVRLKNCLFVGMSESEMSKAILKKDAEWIASGGRSNFAASIRDNSLSEFLRDFQKSDPDRYGEIFLTCRMGATVAMTGTLSDYFQSDEQWWIESFDEGTGKVFLDYRGFDESIGTLALGIVAPVIDDGKVIGIIKVNYKIKEIFDILSVTAEAGDTFESFILNSQGNVVIFNGPFDKYEPSVAAKSHLNTSDSGWKEDIHNGRSTIHAFAPVNSNIFTRVPNPGERKGISGEKWVSSKWHVFLEIDKKEAFASVHSIRNIIILVALLTALAVILLAIFISRALSSPIEALTKSVDKFGHGEQWHNLETEASDEIGMLSKAFNDMVTELNFTTVSRDRLSEEVEDRKTAEELLRNLSERNVAILSAIPDLIVEVDKNKIIKWANRVGIEFYGNDLIGRAASYYFAGEQETDKAVEPIFDDSEEVVYVESWQRRKDGEKRLLAWWCHVLKDEDGKVTGALSTARDITEGKLAEESIKNSLREKETLLKEIHHRVKNNLQIISSLLNLQSGYIDDKRALEVFADSQSRIRSMALVHEMLYKSHDISRVDLPEYIRELVGTVTSTYHTSKGHIEIIFQIDVPVVNIDTAIPLGLISNELITNAFKHAFPEGKDGTITIAYSEDKEGNGTFIFSDNGVGLGDDFNIETTDSLGLRLVKILASQIGGTVEVDLTKGCSFKIFIPAEEKE